MGRWWVDGRRDMEPCAVITARLPRAAGLGCTSRQALRWRPSGEQTAGDRAQEDGAIAGERSSAVGESSLRSAVPTAPLPQADKAENGSLLASPRGRVAAAASSSAAQRSTTAISPRFQACQERRLSTNVDDPVDPQAAPSMTVVISASAFRRECSAPPPKDTAPRRRLLRHRQRTPRTAPPCTQERRLDERCDRADQCSGLRRPVGDAAVPVLDDGEGKKSGATALVSGRRRRLSFMFARRRAPADLLEQASRSGGDQGRRQHREQAADDVLRRC